MIRLKHIAVRFENHFLTRPVSRKLMDSIAVKLQGVRAGLAGADNTRALICDAFFL